MFPLSSLVIILLVLLLFSAFFSASEAALIALNKIRLRHLMENKRRGAERVYGLVSRMDKLIATILIGNNLVNTAIAAIGTLIFTRLFGEQTGVVVATIAITAILIVFGELTPKIFATNHPEGVAFAVRHAISALIGVFGPVTRFMTGLSNGFIRLLGGNPHYRSPLVTEEEIKMMIRIGKEEGYYGDNERKMLERIFRFDEIEVRDVMTPLERLVSVPVNISQEELEKILLEEGHNRIPVYDGEKSRVIGILYVRDLLYLFKNSSLIHLRDLLNAPFFVYAWQRVAELLIEFQRKKVQIAIVLDASKKAVGLVTLEDLIEEIIGEIEEASPKQKQ